MIEVRSTRRQALTGIAAGTAALTSPAVLRAQAATKLRVGYLHVLSVDAHLLLAQHLGAWKKENIDIEMREFTTGIELFQAMVGGSLDVLTTGGVLANFPARGQGKVFLINDLEYATGQIWVHPEQGINSLADLKGKKISTTRGTTAHDLLHQALKSVSLDSNKDVEIVNQRMSEAVTSFIAGAVPAVAIWVPFNVPIKAKAPTAKMIASAGDFPSATIVDGWAARNDFYDKEKGTLKGIVRAWVAANDFLMSKPQEALAMLHDNDYKALSNEDINEMYTATKWFATADWVKHYRDGTVAKWLNQVTNFNVEVGAIQNPLMADKYFDPTIFVDAAGGMAAK